MIINLSKYKKHGYLKAFGFIFVKMFLSQNQKLSWLQDHEAESLLFKSYPRLLDSEDNEKACISCLVCQDLCPAKCITIKSESRSEDFSSGPRPKSFKIQLKDCTRCAICVDVCPTSVLDMQGKYRMEDFDYPVDIKIN